MRNEKKNGMKETVPGYCENRIGLRVSMIGFEDTEKKTSTLAEECILNCSTEGVYKIKLSQQNSDNGPDDTQELLCALICFRVEYFHQ